MMQKHLQMKVLQATTKSDEESSDEVSFRWRESSDLSESEPKKILDIYREELVGQTDLTMEQLNQFSDEHITSLMDRLGLSTESTSPEELTALRDGEIVVVGYENFSDDQLSSTIAPVRVAVVNQTPKNQCYLEWI